MDRGPIRDVARLELLFRLLPAFSTTRLTGNTDENLYQKSQQDMYFQIHY